jgi:hypothetical protein
MNTQRTVVGVFDDRSSAQQAIEALKQVGFQRDQIGLTARSDDEGASWRGEGDEGTGSYAGEGALTGLTAGAGVGALWGLGIVAGMLPAIGPAIAGGTLAAIMSSAAAGAAAAGLAGTLIGLGIPKEEAEFYESELRAGRIIVTVQADGRQTEASSILSRFGAYDMQSRTSNESISDDESRRPHIQTSEPGTSRDSTGASRRIGEPLDRPTTRLLRGPPRPSEVPLEIVDPASLKTSARRSCSMRNRAAACDGIQARGSRE